MKLKHSTSSVILTFLIIFALSYSCRGQSDTIHFDLTHHNNLVIKAFLNESDSVNLMFHTAAHAVTLTTEGVAKQQSIIWDSEEEVKSWGGDSKARFSSSNTISIGDTILDSLPIWETINSGHGTDGKIGLDLFYGSAVEMNFTQNILVIHRATPEIPDGFSKVKLEYEDDMLFIVGTSTIGNESFQNRFLVHTGYGGAILFDDDFALKTEIGSKIEITSEQELKDSYGNTLVTKKGHLSRFRIGEETFENIPVGFFEGSLGRQKVSVLGGELLKRFDMVIDAKREYVYLRSNSMKNDQYTDFD